MLANGVDLEDGVIVELEAEPADDVDFDADEGAMLVLPTAILGCVSVDRGLLEDVRARVGETTQR
jgi:hypothetical protein